MLLLLNFGAMFTGIIETTGIIRKIGHQGTNKNFWIESSLADQLNIDQSISHNGVCLTVEEIEASLHKVTAVLETLEKTNLGDWKMDDSINLERCLTPSARIDGHFVQGHVDTRGVVLEKKDLNGSWEFIFQFPKEFSPLIIEKGSIAVNGTSLTCFDVKNNSFTVAIIPFTYHHTNFKDVEKGHTVNLEFDMLGKYIVRWQETKADRSNLL
jgi:riboflavin synthase